MFKFLILIWCLQVVFSGPKGKGGPQKRGPELVDILKLELDKYCPTWSNWDSWRCWWPDSPVSQAPQSCLYVGPPIAGIPQWIQSYMGVARNSEPSYLQNEFQTRGSPTRCGYCSTTIKCRIRQDPNNPAADIPPWCQNRQLVTGNDGPCAGQQPCEVTPVDGRCSAPLFLMKIENRLKMLDGEDKKEEHGPETEWGDMMKKLFGGSKADAKEFLYGLVNGTNCARDSGSQRGCLCCCGPYIPDVTTRQCRDITPLLPTFDQVFADIADKQQDAMNPFLKTFIRPLMDAVKPNQ